MNSEKMVQRANAADKTERVLVNEPGTLAARISLIVLFALLAIYIALSSSSNEPAERKSRKEVLFWHFWGGADRAVVEEIVDRFNASQDEHYVRAIAMPGNNLDLKLFLAVTGGDPPDLVNQDDPIVADWAYRGALTPLDELASKEEMQQLQQWLFPAARKLGTYRGRLYGLCNGLDIRALYYNKTWLDSLGLKPPSTVDELNHIAYTITPSTTKDPKQFGYLPDPRRLWAWGVVFGGSFYDSQQARLTCNDQRIVEALDWMSSFSKAYGKQTVMAFRQGDQSLPGKTFPLLPIDPQATKGRYALLMDGQWRVRDVEAWQEKRKERNLPSVEFGVCPLPSPSSGKKNAGWVNGNFFLVPRHAGNPQGAWAFMKFWSGFGGNESAAAKTASAGGWIPVSQRVVDQPRFQAFQQKHPLFAKFVELAASPNQHPVPIIPGAPRLNRELKAIGTQAINTPKKSAKELLQEAQTRLQQHIERFQEAK